MGSNPEIQRIQEWVGTWYGGGECPYSMEDIRNICRGPMRQVLLDFLVPRFRTDDQIKVMRSNLFLNDLGQKDNDNTTPGTTGGGGGEDHPQPNQFDQQISILKGKLNEVHQEKIKTVQRLTRNVEKVEESKQTSQASLMGLISHYQNCESRAQLIRERVSSTNILVRDLNNAKPNYAVHANGANGISLTMAPVSTSTPGSDNSPSPSSDSDPLLPQLRGLYNNASELFDLYFLPNSSSGNTSQNSPSPVLTPEIQELTMTVAMQTADLAHSGIPPTVLEKWAKKEQDISAHKIRAISTKFSNVMNPLEELQNETDAIYTRLMYAQIGLHLGNRELSWKVNDLASKNSCRIQDTIFNEPAVIPADLLSLIKKEEMSKQLLKCRELARQLKQIENIAQNNDVDDVLALLCDDDSPNIPEGNKKDGKVESSRKSLRASFGSMDGSGSVSFAKQETLEDISCALLKSIPHSSKQLETTIQQSKNLVLDRFPKILSKDDKRNANDRRKLMSIPTELHNGGISSDDIKIKIPHQFIPNYDLLKDSPPEQNQDDLLSEVFIMQKELEAKKLQSEAILKERGSFVGSKQ